MERRAQFVLLYSRSERVCMEYTWDGNGMDYFVKHARTLVHLTRLID
jgi:hypothetical protein